ncbi:hypothetical protein SAMN04488515_0506 [Cognatiyoonia koreensis]|uniref:Uncharacterized protein n=1 Tax=Cognatiyoonia koreensis TaxID=364200 RepID=A0A1I0NAV0_9RHOB|nr:hypothetical protein [Cognatiyoonia koreensis]SEV98219.1 hypothetical protein SAMN04488515_0506 [Cognatiyoonia koreensis]
MFQPDEDGIFAKITVSGARFQFAFLVQIALGLLLIYMAFISPAGIFGKAIIVVFGIAMLVQANRLRANAKREIWLTDEGIVTNDGTVLAAMDQIVSVSRGSFALKPSNGFSVTLREKHSFLWVPGLWWRFGTRVGIGGITSAGAAKFMAEQLSLRVAQES